VRGRGAAVSLVVVCTTSTLLVPGVAMAADGASAFDGAVGAPIGLGAVAFGVIGLVTGFLRRRKGAPEVSEQNQRVVAPPVEVPTTTKV
jgi:hypothetical protein